MIGTRFINRFNSEKFLFWEIDRFCIQKQQILITLGLLKKFFLKFGTLKIKILKIILKIFFPKNACLGQIIILYPKRAHPHNSGLALRVFFFNFAQSMGLIVHRNYINGLSKKKFGVGWANGHFRIQNVTFCLTALDSL